MPTFLSIWAMQESGLPIDLEPAMRRACLPVLRRLLGPAKYEEYRWGPGGGEGEGKG